MNQEQYELSTVNKVRTRLIASMDPEQGRFIDQSPVLGALVRRYLPGLVEILKKDLASFETRKSMKGLRVLSTLQPELVVLTALSAGLGPILRKTDDVKPDPKWNIGAAIQLELLGKGVKEFEGTETASGPAILNFMLYSSDSNLTSPNIKTRLRSVQTYLVARGLPAHMLSNEVRAQIGLYFLEVFEAAGLITITAPRTVKYKTIRTQLTYMPTEALLDFKDALLGAIGEYGRAGFPCIEPPKPWVSVHDGGFHTPEARTFLPSAVRKALDNPDADYTRILKAINTLQETVWRVNTPVLNIIVDIFQNGIRLHPDLEAKAGNNTPKLGKLTLMPRDPNLMEYPQELAEVKAIDFTDSQLKLDMAWRKAKASAHRAHEHATEERRLFHNVLYTARELENQSIYYVWFADWRGRLYPFGGVLNPQGSDLVKSLLRLEQGHPLDSQDAKDWFYWGGTAFYGFDKAPRADRVQWHNAHRQEILASAADPLNHPFWQTAAEPFMFLAWCLEYARLQRDGNDFESYLLVPMDATCSGIQHFSALTRNEAEGKLVNLTSDPVRHDIYQVVADRVNACLQQPESDPVLDQIRLGWIKHGVDRKVAKNAVMTFVYNSTGYSISEEIYDNQVSTKYGTRAQVFSPDIGVKAANYLGALLQTSAQHVVPSATAVMDYLKASVKQGEQVSWDTPCGLRVTQSYTKRAKLSVTCYSSKKKHRYTVSGAAVAVDRVKHKNGISANFVHSLDASHLIATVNAMAELGVKDLGFIHDSFSAPARVASILSRVLRITFRHQYEDQNWLAQFASDGNQAPAAGSLNLSDILESPFIFS